MTQTAGLGPRESAGGHALHGDLLGERARLTPDREALLFVPRGERFNFGELDRRAGACAAAWRGRLGLVKGDRVGLLAHNRPEFLDCFFATAKSGVVLVPLGTRLVPRELAAIVRDSGMRALVWDGAFAETVNELRKLVPIDRLVALDASADPADLAWRDLVSGPMAGLEPEVAVAPEDLCCLLYTSGTTGQPKGVMISHRMVLANAVNTALSWGLDEQDVAPLFTPLYHAGGLGVFLTALVVTGGRTVLHQGFDPAEVWRVVAEEECTVVFGVPTIWKRLAEDPAFATVDLTRIRFLISGGAPLPLHLIEAYQARGVVFRQGYGLTEVGVNCFSMTNRQSVAKKGSVGRPMLFTRARLVDEAGREVAVGEVGELCLAGPHVCSGYWGQPEATAAALDAEGFWHTGDLARRDADGFLTIAGRKKDMLISGGVNVYPAEIEGELLLCEGVADAAVIGVPHETWGEVAVAFVVARGVAPTPEALAAALGTRLARFKIPKEFVFVAELPRTAYGKVVKGELRERWLAGRGSSPGRSATQETR